LLKLKIKIIFFPQQKLIKNSHLDPKKNLFSKKNKNLKKTSMQAPTNATTFGCFK